MGVLIPFKIESDIKNELIAACKSDKSMKRIITDMPEDKAKEAFSIAQGRLLSITEDMEKADKDFAEFIAKYSEQADNLLIMNAAINYVAEFCAQVPKHAEYDNELDNAYQAVFSGEVARAVIGAVKSCI